MRLTYHDDKERNDDEEDDYKRVDSQLKEVNRHPWVIAGGKGEMDLEDPMMEVCFAYSSCWHDDDDGVDDVDDADDGVGDVDDNDDDDDGADDDDDDDDCGLGDEKYIYTGGSDSHHS